MFADPALAARIDRAEARMCAQIADSIRAVKRDAAPFVLPISGGQAVYVRPSSPINKVIGLGFDADLDVAALERIEREWAARDEAVRIEMSILTDPSLGSTLTDRGAPATATLRRAPGRLRARRRHHRTGLTVAGQRHAPRFRLALCPRDSRETLRPAHVATYTGVTARNERGESLMIGIRRVQRSDAPDERTLSTLRACLDVVERLERSAGEIVGSQIEMAQRRGLRSDRRHISRTDRRMGGE
jgi:hypothetical protein